MDREGTGEPEREMGKGWKTSGKESEVQDLHGQKASMGCREGQAAGGESSLHFKRLLQRQAKCLPNNMARPIRPMDCEEKFPPGHSARCGFEEIVFHHNCPTL